MLGEQSRFGSLSLVGVLLATGGIASSCDDPCSQAKVSPIGLYPTRLSPIGPFTLTASYEREPGPTRLEVTAEFSKDGEPAVLLSAPFEGDLMTLSDSVRVRAPGSAQLRASILCDGRAVAEATATADFYPVLEPEGSVSRRCASLLPFLGGFDCDGVVLNSLGVPDLRFVQAADRRIVVSDGGDARWVWLDGGVQLQRESSTTQWVSLGGAPNWVASERTAVIGTSGLVDEVQGQLRIQPIGPIPEISDASTYFPVFVAERDEDVIALFAERTLSLRSASLVRCELTLDGGVWLAAGLCASLDRALLGVDLAQRSLAVVREESGGGAVEIRDLMSAQLAVVAVLPLDASTQFNSPSIEAIQSGQLPTAWAFFEKNEAGAALSLGTMFAPELLALEGDNYVSASASMVWWPSASPLESTRFSKIRESAVHRTR